MTRTAYVPAPVAAALSRLLAVGRAELTLLWRNKVALTSAVLIPTGSLYVLHRAMPATYGHSPGRSAATAPVLATGAVGLVLLFVVYATLVPAFVARREELVFKRLRTGQLLDIEILAGTALPAVLIAVVQCALIVGVGVAGLGVSAPADPVLLVVGVAVGIVVVCGLAAVTSVWTHSVELAQLTTMPLMLASVAGSGLVVPSSMMPDWLARVVKVLPLTPVMDVVRTAWVGSPDGTPKHLGTAALWGRGLPPAVAATAWAFVVLYATARVFRWEPRQ